GMVCVVGRMRDLILQLSKSSIYSTKPFSGYPHLEEAYRVGELLFPLLDVAVPSIPQPQNLRLQGEAVANEFIPRKVAQS
ncbi:hypothetical protein LVR06_11195, partial [Klebsiella pneumoniae]|nr:hypothetical protein [Klebsiella pneumoniae]